MKKLITFAAMAFLMLGLAQTAAAQPQPTGSPGQDCKQIVEPIFQGAGISLSHPTCVTLLADAGTNGVVGLCKYARDIGAISGSDYGKCVGGTTDVYQVFLDLFDFLVAHGATCLQIEALFAVFEIYFEVQTVGPTALSFAVFAFLAAGWILVQVHRRKARAGVPA